MKSIYIIFSFFILSTLTIHAQEETVFNNHGGIRLSGIWGGSYNAMADFGDNFNLNSGGFFTFEINEDFLIGWEGYDSDIDDNGRDISIDGNDLLLGYAPNSDRVIHPMIYLQAGSGKLEVEDVGSDRVLVIQPSVGAEINIARFFRLGIDGGYRFFNNTDLSGYSDKDFSGPVLGLRLKFGWSW